MKLRGQEQLELVQQFGRFYADQPFGKERTEGLRYYADNSYFGYGDALMLHCVLRWARPRRLVEVGSGFSSAVILDTNDLFLDGGLRCTFIEPFPERLHPMLRSQDADLHAVIERPVQEVPLEVFTELSQGDVLFIDSTHVSKIGSDVNRLVFEILPLLQPGVILHFHDIFYPFEYPRSWVYAGRAWNEAYLLRGFLTFNDEFEILLYNAYLARFHHAEVGGSMPLWKENTGGSLWLRRRL